LSGPAPDRSPDRADEPARRAADSTHSASDTPPCELFPIVYDELRRLAASYLERERTDHTLAPTALVHEAFLKLMGQETAGWKTRGQFFGIAAQAMRRILVDHARMKNAAKRGGGRAGAGGSCEQTPVDAPSLETAFEVYQERAVDLVGLDAALTELEALDPRKARVVELRFFAGMGVQETAEALGIPVRAVERDWTTARAWLRGRVRNDLSAENP